MVAQGWSWLINSKKDHYFVGGRSLCGKWLRFSNSDLSGTSENKCSLCAKREESRRKRKEKV